MGISENLAGCEIVFDGLTWALVEEDLGGSVDCVDQEGSEYEIAKSRIDSVTKLYVEQ